MAAIEEGAQRSLRSMANESSDDRKDAVAGPVSGRRRGAADEDPLRLYLDDIGRHVLLTKDDEVRLARRIEAGREARITLAQPKLPARQRRQLEEVAQDGDRATQAFVNANLRLVVSIAKRYQASGVPLLDLIQEGNLGLIHAVGKFDWRKGFKFSTYATWWIRQAIQRGIANTSRTIRLPIHAGDRLARVLREREYLEAELGRTPRLAELAAALEMTETDVSEILRTGADTRSLSEPTGADSGTEIGELLADPRATEPFEAAASAMLEGDIDRVLAPLQAHERELLRLRFGMDRGEPRQLDELAAHLSLTRDEVRQLEARALCKLRHPSSGNRLRALLDAG
jgi:RNA polymerase sigma factor (sigma-70 family)